MCVGCVWCVKTSRWGSFHSTGIFRYVAFEYVFFCSVGFVWFYCFPKKLQHVLWVCFCWAFGHVSGCVCFLNSYLLLSGWFTLWTRLNIDTIQMWESDLWLVCRLLCTIYCSSNATVCFLNFKRLYVGEYFCINRFFFQLVFAMCDIYECSSIFFLRWRLLRIILKNQNNIKSNLISVDNSFRKKHPHLFKDFQKVLFA